jgi:hypothetical protein
MVLISQQNESSSSRWYRKNKQPSVITAKAANDYHFKTGQRR